MLTLNWPVGCLRLYFIYIMYAFVHYITDEYNCGNPGIATEMRIVWLGDCLQGLKVIPIWRVIVRPSTLLSV